MCNVHSGGVPNGANLTTAKHVAQDVRIVDVHLGHLHLSQIEPKRIQLAFGALDSTLTAAKNVSTHGMVAFCVILEAVADVTTVDVDGNVAVIDSSYSISNRITIMRVGLSQKVDAHRAQTSAAIDGAKYMAAFDGDVGITDHRACNERETREAAACTEHIAFVSSRAPSANMRTRYEGMLFVVVEGVSNGKVGVSPDVTVFATAKNRAENDSITSDVDIGFVRIVPFVEHRALVPIACAIEMASNGVTFNGCFSTRDADGATCHLDGCCLKDIGNLVAAIDGAKDVAALNFH